MVNLLHYTLNTGHTFDLSNKSFERTVLKQLQPIAERARFEGVSHAPLPHPLEAFSVKVTLAPGAGLFDLFDPGQKIVTTNAIAWTEKGSTEVWKRLENLYLTLSRELDTVSISSPPICPDRIPWLATFVLPNPFVEQVTWIADFEQCLALAIIYPRKPQRQAPRGFGSV